MDGHDTVDQLLDQWASGEYELPLQALAVSKRVARIAQHLARLDAAALAPLELDPGEFDVLATLLRSGPPYELTPTALKQQLMISSGGLTKRLTRLEQRGFVTRYLDPDDRRSLLVALSPTGRSLAESAVMAHSDTTADLVHRLAPEEQEQLVALLRKLLITIEQPAPTGATQV
ncbi:MarR family winged helix-turn-helix transcriptional regulator [Streptomyces sp. NPDC096205]|uniref:MarR family winged helix-turn-helix transcriptional regulator n=1 Tax=Streptomyces sp. NPDC096205 TaxID=3366081 RepID=UPI00380C5E06